jgi:hypothetical protein
MRTVRLTAPVPLLLAVLAGPGARTQKPQQPVAPAETPRSQTPGSQTERFAELRWPRDSAAVLAIVDGRPITLADLVRHLDERHRPGFRQSLEPPSDPAVRVVPADRVFQSDLMPQWVRHLADVHALEAELAARKIDPEQARATQEATLTAQFEAWLQAYVIEQRQNGHDVNLSAEQTKRHLAGWVLRSGIAAEMQGLLNFLEPGEYSTDKLREFFQDHARYFGGRVNFAHILIQHRDAGTGILLGDEGRARANARLADVKARLMADGSNFEDVARRLSEDSRTAAEGGLLKGAARFDERLPAILCRTAWGLRDGEVSGPVESPYGWHIVKRIDFDQQHFLFFTDDAIPTVKEQMKRQRQEDLLFEVRKRYQVQLLR